jgi:hypothetical protein
MRRPAFTWIVLLLLSPAAAQAQLTIPSAGNEKFGITGRDNSISVSTAEDGVTLSWSTAKYRTKGDCSQHAPSSPELFQCLNTLSNQPWSFGFTFGITGEKGKGSLLSKGLFTPGASLGFSASYRQEQTTGYLDYYAAISAATHPLKVATFSETGDATIGNDLEKKIGVAGGVNKFFNEHFGVGGSVSVTRALSTPGERTTISLCETQSGAGGEGKTIQAGDCVDGFVAPLADQWVNVVRIETLYNFNRYAQGDKNEPVPIATFGVIASANVTSRTGGPRTVNLAFGPVLHPKGVPHKALVALILKVSDVTEAAPDPKPLRQRFGAVLWFGIPLTGF